MPCGKNIPTKRGLGTAAVAVISKEPGDALPAHVGRRIKGMQRYTVFDAYEGIFSYRTTVRIYW